MLTYLRRVIFFWQEWLEAQRQQQRAFRELASLDDRSLADLGITRADIPYVVFGHQKTQPDRIRENKKRPFVHGAGIPVAFGKGHK